MLSSSLGGEHTEDTGTTAHIQDSLSLEEVGVVHNSLAVCLGTDLVLEHLLVDTEMRIRIEVIVLRGDILHIGGSLGGGLGFSSRGRHGFFCSVFL